MKKQIPPALIVGGCVLLLIIIMGYGYSVLNPPQVLRNGGPQAAPQQQPGAQRNVKPTMATQAGVGDYTK